MPILYSEFWEAFLWVSHLSLDCQLSLWEITWIEAAPDSKYRRLTVNDENKGLWTLLDKHFKQTLRLLLLPVAVVALTSHHVTGQAANQCATSFQTLLTECVKASNLNEKEFLWFVSNGTSPGGQAPADPAAFQKQICPYVCICVNCISICVSVWVCACFYVPGFWSTTNDYRMLTTAWSR